MSRRSLTIIAFVCGAIAAPVGISLISAVALPILAQDDDLVVIQPTDDASDPQEVYLDLVKQKLRLMAPEQLVRETENLRRELLELEANRKLEVAEKQLRALIEQHPESGAANRARFMLDGRARYMLEVQPGARRRPQAEGSQVDPPDLDSETIIRPRRNPVAGELPNAPFYKSEYKPDE